MYSEGTGQPATRRKIPVRGAEDNKSEEISPQSSRQSDTTGPVSTEAVTPLQTNETDWQSMALRLQAEMDNFRRRQMRRADDAIAGEQERLLHLILPVADNLARALNHDDQNDESLRQGVKLIYRELMRVLESEGVTRLETVGQPFDPNFHEAVATVPANTEPDTIIEEIEAGYKLNDKLLRPARVVVTA
jgi:molecular chaperone GrpE